MSIVSTNKLQLDEIVFDSHHDQSKKPKAWQAYKAKWDKINELETRYIKSINVVIVLSQMIIDLD